MNVELSLTGKRWIYEQDVCDPQRVVADIAVKRGIDGSESYNPCILHDIGKAVERIRQALREREHIGIFGDYDCDGITGVAQLVRFFRCGGSDPVVRLPHRVHDGYGLKPRHIEEFVARGISLLLTIDTGVTAHDAVGRARDSGMDVIVIDHHEIRGDLPCATAIIHPNLATPKLTPSPCAAGLAHLLLTALEDAPSHVPLEDRVLAALGTVADLVELRGGNRTMVQEGLAAIPSLLDGPLKDLTLRLASARSGSSLTRARLTSRDIAFRIAPRINAAGRMDDPVIALQALLEGGGALATLETLNVSRREVVEKILGEVLPLLTPGEHLPPLIGLADERFPLGIIGLIAGKLTDRFGRPSMVANITGTTCTASLRSVPAIHITEVLASIQHLLTGYGGHAQAAGCTFPAAHFAAITLELQQAIGRLFPSEQLVPTLSIDAALLLRAITINLCEELQSLEPFGQGNPEPRFLLQNVSLQNLRPMGNAGKHIAASLGSLRTIGFNLSHLLPHLSQPVDIICRLGINAWNGRCTPQIFLEDLRAATPVPVSLPCRRPR